MRSAAVGRLYARLGRRADALRVLANVTKPDEKTPAQQIAVL